MGTSKKKKKRKKTQTICICMTIDYPVVALYHGSDSATPNQEPSPVQFTVHTIFPVFFFFLGQLHTVLRVDFEGRTCS